LVCSLPKLTSAKWLTLAGVVFSIARSRYALPVQLAFLLVNGVGIVLATTYNINTPDLYPNNAHHKIGWIATWVMTAQSIMSLLFLYSGRSKKPDTSAIERAAFLPVSSANMAQHNGSTPYRHAYRWSGDSGSPTGRSSTTLNSPRDISPTDLYRLHKELDDDNETVDDEEGLPMPMPVQTAPSQSRFRIKAVDAFLSRRVPGLFSQRLLKAAEVVYEVIDRTILILGWIALISGGVTLAGWMVSGADPSWGHTGYNANTSLARRPCIQRPCTLHQGRYLLLVWVVDTWSMAGMLCRLRVGLEREAYQV
jgi:hypothetical protein